MVVIQKIRDNEESVSVTQDCASPIKICSAWNEYGDAGPGKTEAYICDNLRTLLVCNMVNWLIYPRQQSCLHTFHVKDPSVLAKADVLLLCVTRMELALYISTVNERSGRKSSKYCGKDFFSFVF